MQNIEEIQRKVNINQLPDNFDRPIIASTSFKRCHNPRFQTTQEKWYQTYTLSEGFAKNKGCDMSFSKNYPEFKVGSEVSAIEALNHLPNIFGLDTRPKIFDNVSKQWVLLDSGSVVSCYPAGPNDILDPTFKLKSVNGGTIDTFGYKEMTLRIGRKTYSIQAIIAAVPTPIFGWDIFRKYKLTLDWNDKGQQILVDKKANIESILKHEVISTDSVPRIQEIHSSQEWESSYFEYQCMKKLNNNESILASIEIAENAEAPFTIDNLPFSAEVDPDTDLYFARNQEALAKLQPTYANLVNKYPSILKTKFNKELKHQITHSIDTGQAKPIKSKVRPLNVNSEKSKQGHKIWQEMEKMGVIERVDPSMLNEWSFPLHLVKKPGQQSYRPCIDYRPINLVTKADCYPLPILKNFNKKIQGSKIFSKLDLRSAFFNLPIHEDSIKKTCVLSPWGGAFVFRRLPFGLKNGPSSWQKFLDHVLSGIDGIYTYLDDILCYSENEEKHLSLLEEIFNRLDHYGLSLALDKCEFGQTSIDYLGFHVNTTGICPLPAKIEALRKIPEPTSQKELLQFLGGLNYFRSCLSGLSKKGKFHNAANLLQPLYSAATVNIPSKRHFGQIWDNSPILKESFEDAKNLLAKATTLAHQDPNLPLALYSDASQHSIGAVLMQKQGHKYVPLGYFSRHLPVEKESWAVYRKELLSAQASIRYFISEIYGRDCTLYSDHKPLCDAYKGGGFQLHDPVAQRALLEISQFVSDVIHVPGKDNTGGDFFSRLQPTIQISSTQLVQSIVEGHKLEALSPKTILEAQRECPEITKIKDSANKWTDLQFGIARFGETELFCELTGAKPRPYLPAPLRKFVIEQLHNGLDHAGEKITKKRVAMYYYWKGIKDQVELFVKTCHGCQSVKPSKLKPPHIGNFELPDQRFSHIHLDIVGPLPPSKEYKYLLTIKDRATKFLQAIPLIKPTSENIAEAFMLHWASIFGLPSICTSDQGPNLTSGIFNGLKENLGIKVTHSPIYHPQTNGLIERAHQSIKNSIKAKFIEMGDKYQDQWIHYLPWALLGIRSAFNSDLGTSSAEMTLGMHPQLPGTVLADPEDINLSPGHMETILTKLQIKNNRVAVPTSLNKPNPIVDPLPDSITHVYVKKHDTKGLSVKYIGPFPVISKPTRSTIQIKVGTNKNGSERFEIRHVSDIKIAHLRDDAVVATRPKRGRPPKTSPDITKTPDTTNQNKNIDDEPFHGFKPQDVAAIKFSVPPPMAGNSSYTTTHADLE